MNESMNFAASLVKKTEEAKEKLQVGGPGAMGAHFELQKVQNEAYENDSLRNEADLEYKAQKFKEHGFDFTDTEGKEVNNGALVAQELLLKGLISDKDLENGLLALPKITFGNYMETLSQPIVVGMYTAGSEQMKERMEAAYETELNHAGYILDDHPSYDKSDIPQVLKRLQRFQAIPGMHDGRMSFGEQEIVPVDDLINQLA